MRRRAFLRLLLLGGSAVVTPRRSAGAGEGGASRQAPGVKVDPRASLYGRWVTRAGLPAFVYEADQEALAAAEWDPIIAPRTRRHWLMVGNRAIRLQLGRDAVGPGFMERSRVPPAGTHLGGGAAVRHAGLPREQHA